MSSSEDDACIYKVPPPPRSNSGSIIHHPAHALEETIPPVLTPKRGSVFSRSTSLLDKQVPTPVPAPRRSSSNRKMSADNVELLSGESGFSLPKLKALSQTDYSKSLDLTETQNWTDDDIFISSLIEQSETTIVTSSVEQEPVFSPQSCAISKDVPSYSVTEINTTNVEPHSQLTKPVPIARPVPKPRTKKLSPQNVESSLSHPSHSFSDQSVEQLSMTYIQSVTELPSEVVLKEERQINYNYPSTSDPNTVEAMLNAEFQKQYGLLSAHQKECSESTDLLSEFNPINSTSADEHGNLSDAENNNYISPDIIRNGLPLISSIDSATVVRVPASPSPHSKKHSPSYIQMNDKKQTHISDGSLSKFLPSAQKHSPVQNAELKNDPGSDVIGNSSSENILISIDSGKGFPSPSTPKPFNDIQPFISKISLTSDSVCKDKQKETKIQNVYHPDADLLWDVTSKPIQTVSKDVSMGKPDESSLYQEDADFVVDWDIAFTKPNISEFSDIFSSRSAVEINGSSETSCYYSDSIQKTTGTTKSFKPQLIEHCDLHEPPIVSPPPLPKQHNNFSEHVPPPLPRRPDNAADQYSQTASQKSPSKNTAVHQSSTSKDSFGDLPTPAFSQKQSSDASQKSPSKNTAVHQSSTSKDIFGDLPTPAFSKKQSSDASQKSPNKNTAVHQSSTSKDIFGDLPTPAFSQKQSSDPFQDSNFDIECYQFNKTQIVSPPSRSPFPEQTAAKAGVSTKDISNTKEAVDPSTDPEHISRFVIPPPNCHEHSSSDSDSTDLAPPETSIQSWNNGDGAQGTRLKVFDSSLLPKKNARYGYLYKQGGYKANKGWKKRWVVYNGTSLSYFSNNTAHVSKRIIPIRCMVSVETDVKPTDKTSFRFKIVTSLKDRVFVFSSDTLDDCLTWANTLMAAVTEYKKSVKVAEQPPIKPDLEGFIKFSNMKRYYVTIIGKMLSYYQSYEDYQMGSPTHEIDMKLASVKVKDHKKLQLWIHYGHFNLTVETEHEMQQWRMAMEDAIAEGLADDTVLKKVYENMSNQHCADCGVENPHWASINLGIVVCKNCAGIHRMFDYRVSKIRSLRMDTRVWTPSLIEMMVTIGNANANAFWEFELPAGAKIQPTESTEKRKEFIFQKYKSKKFCRLHPSANQGPALGEALLNASSNDNVLELMKVLFSGANVLFRKEEHSATAYEVAKEHGQRLIMELLYQNGGDPQLLEQDVTDENRLREDVRLQGFLNKAGPVGRSYEKRWCILEHGALTYYMTEKSKTFKGSIHRKDMHLIQAVECDRTGYSFDLSTGLKDNRIFTFSSDSRDDSGEWIRTIAKLMAPIPVMDQVGMIDIKLAGYAFMKESLVDEWHKTFIVFSWRGIHYMNRDLKFDYLDLRKASGIKLQDSSNGYQQRGPCFVISSTGKSVYLQATLTRDTEKMYTAFLEAIVSSGPTLNDQALTNENVPVIVEKCITHIYMNGLEEKGLYRIAGQNSHIQALLDEFRKDVWSVCLSSYTVQDVSNALKRFLRELDDSVFGRINYPSWIKMAGCKEVNNRLMWYKYYLEKMPQVNFQTLKRIILHLIQVSQCEKVNLMSVTNLASCFAPSLMRTAKDDQPFLASDAAGKEISIMVDLMNNSDYFFNVSENERIILNNIKQAEKEILKRIQENRQSVLDPTTTGILIPVHLLCREGQSVNILVTEDKTAKEAMEYLKRNKSAPDLEIYVLHEQLFKGALERPLFPEDIIARTTNCWMEWDSWVMEDNNVCLCVQGLDLLEKLNTHFNPNHILLSKHQYCDSKPKSRFKRKTIGFRQCTLAVYNDSKGNVELMSWRVEDITIYLGSVHRKTLPPYKHCLTFTVTGEKYTKHPFGHCISFETEDELYRWAAALYAAQHPAGLLSWANE